MFFFKYGGTNDCGQKQNLYCESILTYVADYWALKNQSLWKFAMNGLESDAE